MNNESLLMVGEASKNLCPNHNRFPNWIPAFWCGVTPECQICLVLVTKEMKQRLRGRHEQRHNESTR